MSKKLTRPKPPMKGIVVKEVKKSFWYNLKVKRNNFLNKYYYSFLDRFYPALYKFINSLINEFIKLFRLIVWALIILFILRLFGYELTYLNLISSFAIILILTPITDFIYKIMRID